jgi:toxin ParE1/3/4
MNKWPPRSLASGNKIRLTNRALADLDDINAYLTARSPQGALSVKAAILATFETLKTLPNSGKVQTTPGVRKLGVARYPYNNLYTVDDAAKELVIFTIFHTSHARDYTDT